MCLDPWWPTPSCSIPAWSLRTFRTPHLQQPASHQQHPHDWNPEQHHCRSYRPRFFLRCRKHHFGLLSFYILWYLSSWLISPPSFFCPSEHGPFTLERHHQSPKWDSHHCQRFQEQSSHPNHSPRNYRSPLSGWGKPQHSEKCYRLPMGSKRPLGNH